jgi:hypothetical protein
MNGEKQIEEMAFQQGLISVIQSIFEIVDWSGKINIFEEGLLQLISKYSIDLDIKEQARKETAREIISLLIPPCEACDENWHKGCLCLRATIAEKIAKQYGVEIEE